MKILKNVPQNQMCVHKNISVYFRTCNAGLIDIIQSLKGRKRVVQLTCVTSEPVLICLKVPLPKKTTKLYITTRL